MTLGSACDVERTANKVCKKCGGEKPIGDFYPEKNKKDGRRGECKLCSKQRQNLWRLQNHEKDKQRSKSYKRRRRERVLAHYGGKCVCCNEERYEFLTIDHINGGGRKHRREVGEHICRWLEKNGFPEGFRVLCYNCNCARGQHGYCPHEQNRSVADLTVS